MRPADSQATAHKSFTFFMGSSLEMTRNNEKKVITTGNFQVVHGGAFFLGKSIQWITVPCMNPFEGKKVQRGCPERG